MTALAQLRHDLMHAAEGGIAMVRGDRVIVDQSERLERIRAQTRGRLVMLAVGKAASAMVEAVIVSVPIDQGLLITKHAHLTVNLPPNWVAIEAGHPVPDVHSQRAAHAVAALAESLTADDHLVVLLSGGASALLADPVTSLELADLQATTDVLLASGQPIEVVNAVRRACCYLKGGGLLALAAPAAVTTLALSDVIGDQPAAIGSGPTVPEPLTGLDLAALLDQADLWSRLPTAVVTHLRETVAQRPNAAASNGEFVLVGSNQHACRGAAISARQAGYQVGDLAPPFTHDVAVVAAGCLAAFDARSLDSLDSPPNTHITSTSTPRMLVTGGESTVVLSAKPGRGGRNQALALHLARQLHGRADIAALAIGTDGTDGPTDAAGGLVDGGSWQRMIDAGLDPVAHLHGDDAYPALAAAGDLVRTGPTGTNVADLLLIAALK